MVGRRVAVPRQRLGFTLVEMLVVIGILVLLLSILMPTMGRMREQGRRVQCMNNLRQLAVAAIAYATDDDNGFFIPPVSDSGLFNAGDNFNPWFPKYVSDVKLFVCPSTANVVTPAKNAAGHVVDLLKNAPNATSTSGGHSFELRNFYHTDNTFPDGVKIPRGPSNGGTFEANIPKRLRGGPAIRSSRIMLITDADDDDGGDANNWPDKLPSGGSNDNHGPEGFNCSFMDGRAEWLPTGKPILQAYMDGYYNPSVPPAIMNRYGLYLEGGRYVWR